MAIFDKLGDIAKNVADKTQTFADVSKLNNQITDENNRISALKVNIGNYYYAKFEAGEELDEEIMNYCRAIREGFGNIQNLQAEVARLKSEQNTAAPAGGSPYAAAPAGIACPGCGSMQPAGSKFCPECGAKIAE